VNLKTGGVEAMLSDFDAQIIARRIIRELREKGHSDEWEAMLEVMGGGDPRRRKELERHMHELLEITKDTHI
jgi:hypothetical protein